MNFRLFIIILVLCSWQTLASQTKNESEQRIKLSEFPKKAQDVIEALPSNSKRIKFYKETDGGKESFEAKFKYNKRYYSLEFSKEGDIEDIEVITKLKHIKQTSKHQLVKYFEASFDKYKIIKIQEQFIFKKNNAESKFVEEVLTKDINLSPNFEIIAEVKNESKRNIREFTFDSKGKFLNFRILNPTSYEHVLY